MVGSSHYSVVSAQDRVVTLRQKLVHTLGMVRRFRLLAGCCVLSGNMTLEVYPGWK